MQGHCIEDGGGCSRLIKDGVPPPKKIEATVRPCVNAARCASSALKAPTKRASSTGFARTWLLKSQ
jgi:hypothetical protein